MMRAMLLIVTAATLLGGCFLSADEDKIGETNTDTTTYDQESVQPGTGSDTCVPGTDPIEGMGDTCNSTDDCDTAAPDCLKNPFAPDQPGQCAVTGCIAGCCPVGYSCCTCSNPQFPVQTCLPPDMANLVESNCGGDTACD